MIYLLHGFNVWDDGADSVGQLQPLLPASSKILSYGWFGPLQVIFHSKSVARKLTAQARPGDIAIGHSNGAYIINKAIWSFNAPLSRLIYIAPALDKDMPLPRHVDRCDVFYDPKDWIVELAGYVPPFGWGKMGRYGYQGNDLRYHNHALPGMGHSRYFKDRKSLAKIASYAD